MPFFRGQPADGKKDSLIGQHVPQAARFLGQLARKMMRVTVDRIMNDVDPLSPNAASLEQDSKFFANRHGGVAPSERPAIELLIELNFEILGRISMVKSDPAEIAFPEQ